VIGVLMVFFDKKGMVALENRLFLPLVAIIATFMPEGDIRQDDWVFSPTPPLRG